MREGYTCSMSRRWPNAITEYAETFYDAIKNSSLKNRILALLLRLSADPIVLQQLFL
jgi:hypothetical protein